MVLSVLQYLQSFGSYSNLATRGDDPVPLGAMLCAVLCRVDFRRFRVKVSEIWHVDVVEGIKTR